MLNYKLTDTGVQNTETTAFIPNDGRNRDWVEYQNWLKGLGADGADLGTGINIPGPQDQPVQLVVDEDEEKIKAKMRELAIDALIITGDLPATVQIKEK